MKNSYKIAEVINVVDNKASVDNAVEKYSELKLELSLLVDKINFCKGKYEEVCDERDKMYEIIKGFNNKKAELINRIEEAGNTILTEISKNVEKQKEIEKIS